MNMAGDVFISYRKRIKSHVAKVLVYPLVSYKVVKGLDFLRTVCFWLITWVRTSPLPKLVLQAHVSVVCALSHCTWHVVSEMLREARRVRGRGSGCRAGLVKVSI